MKNQTEARAAKGILERGIRTKVRAPFFLRLLRIKTIPLTLRMLYGGTLFRVSEYYLSTGITSDELKEVSAERALELQAKHGKTIYRAVACALLNGRRRDWLFGKLLANHLLENMPIREALLLLEICLIHNGTADFMSITRYVRNLMITEPTNQGQKKAGS